MITKKTKKTLLLAAKLLGACILIYLIYTQVHWADFVDSNGISQKGLGTYLSEIKLELAIPGLGGFFLSLLIISIRWKILLGVQSIRVGWWKMVRLTFMGEFFNTIVPGTVGGDLVKAYCLTKHTERKATVWLSVFVDRTLGLAGLGGLAIVMTVVILACEIETFEHMKIPAISACLAVGAVTVVLLFIFSSKLRRVLHLQKIYSSLPIAKHFQEASGAAEVFRSRIDVLAGAIGLTILAHMCWIGGLALLGMSLSLDVPIYAYFVYIPLIYIAGALPTTPGGVGLVEELYVIFFATSSPSAAIALALLARLCRITVAIPGAIVTLTGTKLPKIDQLQNEMQKNT